MDPAYRPFAALLNRGIRESVTARAVCAELEGRSLGIEISPPGLHLRLAVHDGQVSLGPAGEAAADASLSGGPLGFSRALFGDADAAIRAGRLRLAGDGDIAQGFYRLLRLAGPEPEEELARLIGDVAAHQVGEATRGLLDWARRTADSLRRDVAGYLQDERGDLPTRAEMEDFLAGVDRLASDVDRAAARAGRLTRGS